MVPKKFLLGAACLALSANALADASFVMNCYNPKWSPINFTSDGNSGEMITPNVQFNVNMDAKAESTIGVHPGTAGVCEVTILSKHVFTGPASFVLTNDWAGSKDLSRPYTTVRATRLGNKMMKWQVDKAYEGKSIQAVTILRFTAQYRAQD